MPPGVTKPPQKMSPPPCGAGILPWSRSTQPWWAEEADDIFVGRASPPDLPSFAPAGLGIYGSPASTVDTAAAIGRPCGTEDNSGRARGAHARSNPRCLPPEALPPDPRGFPLVANSMAGEEVMRCGSRCRHSPGRETTYHSAIMPLAQCEECPGVWGWRPQEYGKIRRCHT